MSFDDWNPVDLFAYPTAYITFAAGTPPPLRLPAAFALKWICDRCGDSFWTQVGGSAQLQELQNRRRECYSCAGECSAAEQSHENLRIEAGR